jgi:Zn-dependent protease with chaperone function
MRPRLGRLKPLLKDGYLVERQHAPTLHRMIDRLAADLDAPRPDLVIFDFSWNAATARIGVRQTRVLTMGVPLLLALTPQQIVALVGHELGHLKYEDSRRGLLLQPARTTFGRLARMVKPPHVALLRGGISPFVVPLLAWQMVGGTAFLLLWSAHAAVNAAMSAQDRAIELRADRLAARAAGTTAALEMLDVLVALADLSGYVQRHVVKGQAAASWRRFMRGVHVREAHLWPARRQLSIRTDASLFASHPAPGRRHQWLSAQPELPVGLLVEEAAGAGIEREIAPYAEFLHSEMMERALI